RFAYKFLPIGIVIGCLLLSYSRGALIAFIGQILLLTILLSRRHAAGSTIIAPLRRIASALCIGFVVFVSANELRSMLYPVESATEKITFQSAEGRSSVDERLQFWKHSALLTLQQPLFGFGPYSFRFVHPQYQQHVLTTSDHPHNLFLKFSAERGIPAALLFGCFLFLVLVAGLRLSRSGKRLPESLDSVRLGSALLTTSVAGTIAHNLIDYNLQFVGIALPLFLTMGFLLRHAPSFHFVRLPASITGRRIRNTLACCSLLLLLIALREGWYLVTSSAGRHAEASGNAEAALGWYKTSSAEWFSRDLFLSEAHLLLAQGKPDEATASLNRYLTFNSSDARALKLKGEIALLEDDFESAIAAFHQAFQLAGWNDMGIARGLLEALFAESYQQPTTNAAADSRNLALNPEIALVSPEIERRARAFADAIEQNLHFVALSPNVEETVKVLIMLSVLYPEKTDEFHSLINTIEQKASEERMRTRSRPPGFLW
ncbi:MAG TPA: O-antigen ligase family protein, partial [Candidatus Peribacterales bacterium]|nr:O-antigen ligase family protein [Candidatus Peribacterales bacterium]